MYFEIMEFLARNQKWIIFSHVLSAIILMGGFITLSVSVSHLVDTENVKEYTLRTVMSIVKRYLYFVAPLFVVLLISAIIMQIGFIYDNSNPIFLTIVHTNNFIWGFMFALYIYIVKKRYDAHKHYEAENFSACKNDLILIVRYLFILEFVLGAIASYFGLILKGV